MTESFYDLLEVSTDADVDEIERAYRQRIKETHPDVNDDPEASAETARLVEARDVLIDEDERARYDRLGHESYVESGSREPGGASGSWSGRAAADAARSTSSSDGPTNTRASAEERRRRERRARRDVDFDRGDARSSRNDDRSTHDEGSTTATNGGTASADRTTGPRRNGSATSATRGPPPWSDTSQGWAARSPAQPPPGLATQTVTAVREAPATALVTFFLYPLLVFGTFFPPFPLLVNAIVGTCLLAIVGAAQTVVGLGVAIYGTWTVLGTVGVLAIGASPFSPLGLVVLGTTWLPLGFSILTYQVLDA